MPPVARLGDMGSHGSVIISASTDTLTDGLGTARLGDLVQCPKKGHGVTPIISGSGSVLTNGAPTARLGDLCACGSVIIAGSPTRDVGDSPSGGGDFESIDGFQPWVTPAEAAVQSTEDHVGPITPKQRELYQKAGIDPDQKNPDPPPTSDEPPAPAPPPPNTPVPTDCSDLASVTSFPPSFKLSNNFALAHVSTACLLEKSAVQAQCGLTIQQVVCNLRNLAVNVLEPLTEKFGRPNINCGFRGAGASYGSPTSDHKLGAAVDLQWAGLTDEDYYERACWIRDNLQWKQIILEWGGNRPWIHVAYLSSKLNRTNLLSRITVANGYKPGLILCKNVPKVGGTRV